MGPKKLSATTSVVAIVIALAAVLQTAEAETHKVSWNNTVGANYYTSWAANQTFKVGDLLGNYFRSYANQGHLSPHISTGLANF